MKTKNFSDESGAALIAVIFISILLVTASAMLLTAVGHNSRNSTDVLAETKAYYAAESGLQASIDVLRNGGIAYSDAAMSIDLRKGDFTNPNIGLTYNVATDRVEISTTEKYSIQVSNPEASLPQTFQTSGTFTAIAGTATKDNGRTICIPDCTNTTARTEITFQNAGATNIVVSPNPELGRFSVTYPTGTGVAVPALIQFRLQFQLTSPRSATRTIRAETVATGAGAAVVLDFSTTSFVPTYLLLGTTLKVCSPQTTCPADTFGFTTADGAMPIHVKFDKLIEPNRLVVRSTGYGPYGAKKMLEGVLQKDFFDDLASTSAIAMIGPAPDLVFDAGSGGPRYCGVDGGYEPGDDVPNTPPCIMDPNTPTGPSVGVTDPNGLQTVIDGGSGAFLSPPPAVVTDLPDWQQSAAEMDRFVRLMRTTSVNSGTYIANGGSVGTPGSHATGRGITFCEGDCTAGPVSGGGILVVTGSFHYHGNFSFNGLIIVTGSAGMHRDGGGGGQIIGNIVIAPYDPLNLGLGFGSPKFTTNGGGNSDILFGGTSAAFDGTTAVTNLMLGIAEK